jgi:hypothetical protein
MLRKGTVGSGQLPLRAHCLDVGKMVTVLHSPAQPIHISSSNKTKSWEGKQTSVSRGNDSRLPSPALPLPDPVREGSFAIRTGSATT